MVPSAANPRLRQYVPPEPIIKFRSLNDGGALYVTENRSSGVFITSRMTQTGGIVCNGISESTHPIDISDDRKAYTVGSSPTRTLSAPATFIVAGEKGELVVVDHEVLESPFNVFRFESSGALRWRLQPHSFGPKYQFISSARFLDAERSVIHGYYGWEATVSEANGSVLESIATNLK